MKRFTPVFLLLFVCSSTAFSQQPVQQRKIQSPNLTVDCPPTFFADRIEAIQLLLSPASGFDYTSVGSNLWLPFIDFGFGPGFEGLVQAGTTIYPYDNSNFFFTENPRYFFFVDDDPSGRYAHPTRFVLLDPTNCEASVSNGGIQVYNLEWWPIVITPMEDMIELFRDGFTDDPPGPGNPDGLVQGNAPSSDDVNIPEPAEPAASPSKSAGLVVAGDGRADMVADIPRWKKELQEKYGVDSDSILCPSNGAITIDTFCKYMDQLAEKKDADKYYIRISSHGSPGKLWFADGSISKEALCTKFKNLAKNGKPICLIIDACHSSSLLDANNWNFPAGSQIFTAATNGQTALGVTGGVELDENGVPIPGSSVTAGLYSHAFIKCRNDMSDEDMDGKPDVDTNGDGVVSDCEAHEWVVKKKPCYQKNLGMSGMIGSYTINCFRLYPAGPPAGVMIDSMIMIRGRSYGISGTCIVPMNPMPVKRVVGNFSNRMNFNVQNNSGSAKMQFCMVFKGDVSGGIGLSWNSTAGDNIGSTWSGSATSTYDPATDETTVCWMASGSAAANGAWVHFGYTAPDGKQLRPVRQHWGSGSGNNFQANLSVPDSDKVPTTESDAALNDVGDTLHIRTVNRGLAADGWGEAVSYTIGYRISNVEIPLAALSLGNSAVSSLPYQAVNSGMLDADSEFNFSLTVPDDIEVGQYLILQVSLSWNLNSNTTMQLLQWEVLKPAICLDDVVYTSASTIPAQTNSSGTITVDDVVVSSGTTTFNAKEVVVLGTGTHFQSGSEVHVYTFGCDGSVAPSNNANTVSTAIVQSQLSELQQSEKFRVREMPLTVVPNPFTEHILIRYKLQTDENVYLAIYDLNGKQVAVLLNGVHAAQGVHTIEHSTADMPEGLYVAILRAGKETFPMKLVKVKP